MTFLRSNAIAILAAMLLIGCAGASAADRPNIIHIMVDDAGVGDFTSYWESSPIETPNLDQLAAGGMRFTRAYAGSTNCAPSRSALMTGYHGGHTFMRSNSGTASIRDRDVTIAEVLQTAGYTTGGYGKWGLGSPGLPGTPERQGFDEFVGYYNQVHAHSHYPDRLYDTGNPLLIPENNGFNEPETGLVSDGRVHAHSIIYDRMKEFVQENAQQQQPFYAWGAWTPPHRKSTLPNATAAPGGYYALYDSKPGWNDFDKIQAGFVSWIDAQVGDLLDTLEDPNGDGDTSDSVAGNTLVIFTSDNGGWENGQHAWDRNRETIGGTDVNLRGSKEGPYEGGVRSPMIAYWPGKIQAGSESDRLTTFYDFMPSFAELAGSSDAVPQDIDGLSFVPTITGVGTQQHHEGIYFEDYSYDPNGSPEQIARIGGWKLIRRHGGNLELYDLANDPGETSNLSGNATHAATRDQLVAYMDANHSPKTAQFAVEPPNVGTGNAARDGVVENGIRPDGDIGRMWHIAEGGDAKSLDRQALSQGNQPVEVFFDDWQQEYTVDVELSRLGDNSPILTVELLGSSGFSYFSGTYDTSQLAIGEMKSVSIPLEVTTVTPSTSTAGADLGKNFTVHLAHAGSPGEIMIDSLSILPNGAEAVVLGDLNGDGRVTIEDWNRFKINYQTMALHDLTPSELLSVGDFDVNGVYSLADTIRFKQFYEASNGVGSFGAISAVPESPAALLLGVGLVCGRLFQTLSNQLVSQ